MAEANQAAAVDAELNIDEAANDKAPQVSEASANADVAVNADKPVVANENQADKPADKPDDSADDKSAALPDNWRELAAGDDEDTLKILKRYGSLNGLAKALVEKEKLIRSGKIKRDMPDPKDEKAMSEWRKDQGIPTDPTGYQLPETVTKRLIDEDKPILSSFTEFAHTKNLPASAVEAAAEWYVNMQETAAEERGLADASAAEQVEEALRDEWSRDEFKGNRTLAKRFWDATGIDGLAEARMPDGRRLGDTKEFILFSSDRGREMFGDVVFASADGEARQASRKAEIEKIRDTDFDRYESEGLDKELTAITDKELRRGKR